MQFTKLTTMASLLAFAVATPVPEASPAANAEASPVAEAEPFPSPDADTISAIVKRAEGVHLVNCSKNGRDVYSAVVVSIPLFDIQEANSLTAKSSVPTIATATSSLGLEINASQGAVELHTGKVLRRAAPSLELVLLSPGT